MPGKDDERRRNSADRSEFENHSETEFADRPAIGSASGRQREPADARSPDEMPAAREDAGEFEAGEAEPDDLWKAVQTRPAREETARRGETPDGLDPTEEAVRRYAEDLPPGTRNG